MATAVATSQPSGLFSFDGRINRGRYWATIGGIFVGALVLGIVAAVAIPSFASKGGAAATGVPSTGMPMGVIALAVLFYAAVIWIKLAADAKRWHDLDKTGWLALLSIIPGVNLIVLIYLGVAEGTAGPNRFGSPPG